jgi:tRNA dimethylallyltransferase
MEKALPKIIAVVGPTASGKSGLAEEIAKQFDGELICADSRQLYRGMNIGTAKDKGKWQDCDWGRAYVLESGIIEHLVDMLDPDEEFNVSDYQRLANEKIHNVLERGKLPILVGGTGLYLKAVIDNLSFPDVAPNEEIRKRLNVKSLDDLQKTYAACDPIGATAIDENNKRRLVRAIEVCMVTQKPYSSFSKNGKSKYDVLQLGVELYRESLYQRIDHRAIGMIQDGLVDEVQQLIDSGVDPTKSAMAGIGYKEAVDHLQGDISINEMIALVQRNSRHLAKRQLTWFKRDSRIKWTTSNDEALQLVRGFLGK